ncbi:MAG: TldD/PmbA family protein [Pseudomonadota bacterium]
MKTDQAETVLSAVLDHARAAGAEGADALVYSSVSSGVTWRLGALEEIDRSEGRDLGLRVLIGNRQACVSTNDFSPAMLKELAERCVDMARTAPADPWCGLAPADRLAKAPFKSIDMGDFAEPSTEQLKAHAGACEAAALEVDGVSNSSGASASYGEGQSWFATSTGFMGTSAGSYHSVSVSVLAQDENGMERDYDYDSRTHTGDMRSAEAIGARAGARTVARLSPRKVKSQTAPVIFDKRLSASLLGHLAGAINGAAIARGVSFLKDKLGTQIFPKTVMVTDDPHLPRRMGSRAFDGEGLANGPLDIIDGGVLTAWLLNSAHARQLNLEPNGRASRGTGGPPGATTTNLTMAPGPHSFDDLVRDAGTGLLMTDMFGPQVNSNTGDYSVGCSGFWIDKGEVTHPVSEITIAGNILEMYATLVPANDLEFTGSTNAPSLLIPAMTIAGD